MPTLPSLRQMLENGVHFGHVSSRWNPNMKPYIYGERDKIHVINLEQTRAQLERALTYLATVIDRGGTVLFVGTKRQAHDLVKETAMAVNMPFIVERWFGGTLTNFSVLRKNIKVLEDMENADLTENTSMTKKERLKSDEKKRKLLKMLEGVRSMTKVPDALFVVDAGKESIAIAEARALKIPVVAIVDTNANPRSIDYPIPGNDDAAKSLTLLLGVIKDSLKGFQGQVIEKQKVEAMAVEAAKAIVQEPAKTEASKTVVAKKPRPKAVKTDEALVTA